MELNTVDELIEDIRVDCLNVGLGVGTIDDGVDLLHGVGALGQHGDEALQEPAVEVGHDRVCFLDVGLR